MRYLIERSVKKQMANKPIAKFKSGSIDSAIWLNDISKDGKKFQMKTISLTRSYTKDDGKTWEKEVINFRPQQLINLLVVLNQIQTALFLNVKEDKEAE